MTHRNAATANDTGSPAERPKVDRRTFLAASAAAPFANPALAKSQDRLPAWIADWSRLEDEAMKRPDDTPEGEALWNALKAYENRILDTPAVSHEGFKASLLGRKNRCGLPRG